MRTFNNKFYKKVGMKKVGYINWSNGNMKGTVWLKVKKLEKPREGLLRQEDSYLMKEKMVRYIEKKR